MVIGLSAVYTSVGNITEETIRKTVAKRSVAVVAMTFTMDAYRAFETYQAGDVINQSFTGQWILLLLQFLSKFMQT